MRTGQYVMFGYVKTLDNFRLQCRWRYPEKGDERLAHCPAYVNLIAAKEIQFMGFLFVYFRIYSYI